ncbi:hypothetical protein Krad_2501 [Kineococcus radiotolerans SRS30216 = ATCC BAA-149]|uniref:Uncharacterized protein n=1 Tax=Kineococcus radiotolerans (strain ATCC BAA-149 / DSM 14245 / SRS30216) TaxID=266940 RepID=A6WAY8_KINRD|nr:hypothetical protein Krad_2501 [Kineococcus radiotolerans SRS30216 = ATCC BAA-149]
MIALRRSHGHPALGARRWLSFPRCLRLLRKQVAHRRDWCASSTSSTSPRCAAPAARARPLELDRSRPDRTSPAPARRPPPSGPSPRATLSWPSAQPHVPARGRAQLPQRPPSPAQGAAEPRPPARCSPGQSAVRPGESGDSSALRAARDVTAVPRIGAMSRPSCPSAASSSCPGRLDHSGPSQMAQPPAESRPWEHHSRHSDPRVTAPPRLFDAPPRENPRAAAPRCCPPDRRRVGLRGARRHRLAVRSTGVAPGGGDGRRQRPGRRPLEHVDRHGRHEVGTGSPSSALLGLTKGGRRVVRCRGDS